MAEDDEVTPPPIAVDIETPSTAPVVEDAGTINQLTYANLQRRLIQGINYGLNAQAFSPLYRDLANIYNAAAAPGPTVRAGGQQARPGERLTFRYIDELSDWEYVRGGHPLPRRDYDHAAPDDEDDRVADGGGGVRLGTWEGGPERPARERPTLHGWVNGPFAPWPEHPRVEAVPTQDRKAQVSVRGTDNTRNVINLIGSIPDCDIRTAALFLSDGRAVRITPQEVREISLVKFVDSLVEQVRRSSRTEERVINLNLSPTMKLDLVPHGVSILHCYVPAETQVITYEGSLCDRPAYGLKVPWVELAECFFPRPPDKIEGQRISYMRYHFTVNIPATIWKLRMRWPQTGQTPVYELPGTSVYAVGKRFLRHLNIGNVNMGSGSICWGSGNESIRPANPEDVRLIYYKSLFNNDLTNPRYFTFAEGGSRLVHWLVKQKKKPSAIPARFVVGGFYRNLGGVENYFAHTRNESLYVAVE